MITGIADQILSQAFVDDVVRGMKAWDIKGCAVVVVPMTGGMGPPAGKFFGEREKGKLMTRNVSCLPFSSRTQIHARFPFFALCMLLPVPELTI